MRTGNGSDKGLNFEIPPDDIEQALVDARRRARVATRTKYLAISVAIILVIAIMAVLFLPRGCLDCDGYHGFHPWADLTVYNGTGGWTISVVSVSQAMRLDSINVTILDSDGAPLPHLIMVRLSNLTIGNCATYHARYQKVLNETVLAVGGQLIIEKAEYPRASYLLLYFQSYVVSQVEIPRAR